MPGERLSRGLPECASALSKISFRWHNQSNVNAKRKGTKNEHRSIRLLEAAGYACTRAAASLGAWDIIGVGSTDFALVQVKTRDWPGSGGNRKPETVSGAAHPALQAERDFPCTAGICDH